MSKELKYLSPLEVLVEGVCEALSKHDGGENVVYENGNFYVVGDGWREVIVVSMKDNNGNYVIDFCGDTFPPHLVTMIGRFYEGNYCSNCGKALEWDNNK